MYGENSGYRRNGGGGEYVRRAGSGKNRYVGRRSSFSLRMKISTGLVIGVLLLNRADAGMVSAAAERIGADRDYTAEDIKEAVSGAYSEAQAVMSQKMSDVFEVPYTSPDVLNNDDKEKGSQAADVPSGQDGEEAGAGNVAGAAGGSVPAGTAEDG